MDLKSVSLNIARKLSYMFTFISIIFLGYIFFVFAVNENNELLPNGQLNIKLISINGTLLSDGKFLVTPDPSGQNQSLEITDNTSSDANKTNGLISLINIPSDVYVVTQLTSREGYLPSTISKIIPINESTKKLSVTFVNNIKSAPLSNTILSNNVNFLTYNAKFVCGSIRGEEGPLRPGHYDTDISIFNKQNEPINLYWNGVTNNGTSTNSILKKLNAESSTGIVCNDIRNLINSNSKNTAFVEGFVILRADITNYGFRTDSKDEIQQNIVEPINVQVFYTANALDSLPHEIIIDNFVFQILDDASGKIPVEFLNTDLDISVSSGLNSLSSQASNIKKILESKFNLTSLEASKINLSIKESNIGVGAMIDDHAISSVRLSPEFMN